MPPRASSTVSPSSVRTRRSTPCVDGCCGPMFTTSRSSSLSCAPWTTSSQSCPPTLKTVPSVASSAPYASYSLVALTFSLPSRTTRPSPAAPLARRLAAPWCSYVRPPLVRRRHGGPAVLDGDAAEGVVLALRVAHPVVRHHDPGQRRVPVEDQAEEVVRLALVPVVGRVDRHDRRDVRVGVGAGHLEPDAPVVRDRQQRIDRVQLGAGVFGEVHAGDAEAHLEAEPRVVAQDLHDAEEVLAAYDERQLAAVDDHPLDRVAEVGVGLGEKVGDLVELALGTGRARPAVRAVAAGLRRLA